MKGLKAKEEEGRRSEGGRGLHLRKASRGLHLRKRWLEGSLKGTSRGLEGSFKLFHLVRQFPAGVWVLFVGWFVFSCFSFPGNLSSQSIPVVDRPCLALVRQRVECTSTSGRGNGDAEAHGDGCSPFDVSALI